jgi:hypothetical protein
MTHPKRTLKLKQLKFKNVTIKGLEEYNKVFKYWWMCLTRNIHDTKETIQAYLDGFSTEILMLLKVEGYNSNNVRTLAKWQSIMKSILAKYGPKDTKQDKKTQLAGSSTKPLL